jgi:hypothetical protein
MPGFVHCYRGVLSTAVASFCVLVCVDAVHMCSILDCGVMHALASDMPLATTVCWQHIAASCIHRLLRVCADQHLCGHVFNWDACFLGALAGGSGRSSCSVMVGAGWCLFTSIRARWAMQVALLGAAVHHRNHSVGSVASLQEFFPRGLISLHCIELLLH